MGTTSTSTRWSSPIRMMAVSPNSFWMWEMARSRFLRRAAASFSAALSTTGVADLADLAGLAAAVDLEESAFLSAMDLGIAAVVLMTILRF